MALVIVDDDDDDDVVVVVVVVMKTPFAFVFVDVYYYPGRNWTSGIRQCRFDRIDRKAQRD